MSDPDTMERYCSSYYDKHGLYNDGFPCPANKYCCQSTDGGSKMCCSMPAVENSSKSDAKKKSNGILDTIVTPPSPVLNSNNARTTLASNLNEFLLEQKLFQNSLNSNNRHHQYKQSSYQNGFLDSSRGTLMGAGGDAGVASNSEVLSLSPQTSIAYSSFTLPFFLTK